MSTTLPRHVPQATTKFRYELVRLLNLSFYCYTLMLKGLKLVTPPASLIPLEGGVMEAEVLSVVSCPTAMVCKWITSLLEEQRQAARITDQQVSVMTTELIKLMKARYSEMQPEIQRDAARDDLEMTRADLELTSS